MNHITGFRLGTLAVLITAASVLAWPEPTYAQTQGMERRDDHRDDRDAGRAAKQDCKAGDEKTRAECRGEKRDTKHGSDDAGTANTAPAPTPPK